MKRMMGIGGFATTKVRASACMRACVCGAGGGRTLSGAACAQNHAVEDNKKTAARGCAVRRCGFASVVLRAAAAQVHGKTDEAQVQAVHEPEGCVCVCARGPSGARRHVAPTGGFNRPLAPIK